MIDFIDVSKSYGKRDIFDHASFRINKGERVGIVGPNGSGKSTMFQIICDEISADKGEIILPKKARIGHLHQQLDFFRDEDPLISFASTASGELPKILERIHQLEADVKELSAEKERQSALDEIGHLQSVYESLGGYEMKHRAAAALAGLGFKETDLEKPMGAFSGGWQMRACMAKTLLGEPDILLLDEPSNYLDTPAVEWLQKRLRNYSGTLLLISHDRFLLNSITNITLEVDNGHVTRYQGNYNYYVHEREERRRHAEAAQENIDRKKEQLERNINRFRAKASKAAQVQSWIKMLDRIEDADVPDDLHFRGAIRIPDPPHSGAETMRLEDVSFSYDGKRNILENISLSVARGDKLGIVGYNGMGKTTLLKILAGVLTPTGGTRVPGHKVITGYQAQEFAGLLTHDMTAFDIVREASGGNVPSQRIREILGAFGFSGESAEKQCKVLSGGEKIRLCFARIFVNPPNFLVLDEPTTHLDIAAREALQQAICNYTGTVCIVSHDIEFLRGTVTGIVEMRSPGIRLHYGNYDYYRERIAAEQNAEKAAASGSTETGSPDLNSKERRRERAQKRQEMSKDKRRLENEVARLEKLIETSEIEKEQIIAALAAPSGGVDFAGLQKKLNELDRTITETTEHWERSASELEELMTAYNALHED